MKEMRVVMHDRDSLTCTLCLSTMRMSGIGSYITLANFVYSALWCVFRRLIKLLVLDDVLPLAPLDALAEESLQSASLQSTSLISK